MTLLTDGPSVLKTFAVCHSRGAGNSPLSVLLTKSLPYWCITDALSIGREPSLAWTIQRLLRATEPGLTALLPTVNESDSTWNARILGNAKDARLENCNITAVGGNMNVITYNLGLVVPTDVYRKVVAWISIVNYQDIQDDNLSKQLGETSMWVLGEPVFVEWTASKRGILWGTGMHESGAGKTVLASIVVNHLRKRAATNERILVAFAYCRYTDSLSIREILAAIIRQILEDYPSTFVFVQPLYDKHELRGTKPTEAELVATLSAIFVSDMFDQRFLFIDSLDEANSDTQFNILDTLSQLPLNVLFTSRPLPLLKESVPEVRFFDIIVRDADIKKLINEKIRRMKTLAKLLELDGWRERVLKMVLERSSGMFLVASLQLDMLGSCLNLKELRSSLDDLPKGVHEMYTATMQRIENQSNPGMAKRVLIMLAYTLESLHIDELRHAIAVESVGSKYDPELLVDRDSFVSMCCGLITIEPQNYTAKDFLEHYLKKDYPEPHALIASSCVARMMHFGLHNRPDNILYYDTGSLFEENPFLSYSYRQWAAHSHSCTSVPPEVVGFILRCCHFPIFAAHHGGVLDLVSSVHIAAAFDFHNILGEWFGQPQSSSPNPLLPHPLDVNMGTLDNGTTALYLASRFGHIKTVRVLLNVEGIDACPAADGITPLMIVSRYGQLEIVELLLGVSTVEQINATHEDGWTALQCTSYYSHGKVARLLRSRGATR
ncbi:hypothetical protein FA15DRAFT_710402 [Coprinopsis marcescibilis]|uniref:Nephrocystin 3-like N-terminal domain-containing protein n=1 Tax=Coprinopsis marcescibilis TaxID=230819 RepID=A0A5C3KDP0_COPMA|nr:hypothetical protein FA15DRAFT_710402 [Coprinopsis marcescibilis]